jgi:arabinan endo-1,5-alpha-L-arabinosidase
MVAAPFATGDEELKEGGYHSNSEIEGIYYYVNHGTDIGPEIHTYQKIELKKNGKIIRNGEKVGTYTMIKGKCFISLILDGITYKGVVLEMKDEADNRTRCFSAVGNNNETIWGVSYIK